MFSITSIEDERIALYKSLKFTPAEHTEQNVFIAEGPIVVSNLLTSSLNVKSFFSTPEYYCEFNDKIIAKKIPEENIFKADKGLMNHIVGFNLHYGVLAIGEQPLNAKLSDLGDVIVVFNGIVNSENIGAIIRNATAFGADSIIYDNSSSSPFLRRAVRVSMGSVFFAKVHKSENLIDTIFELKKSNYRIIGAELSKESIPIENIEFSKKNVIIFGAEGPGVEDNILNLCDNIAHIPINNKFNSINVSSASAIFLYNLCNKIM